MHYISLLILILIIVIGTIILLTWASIECIKDFIYRDRDVDNLILSFIGFAFVIFLICITITVFKIITI